MFQSISVRIARSCAGALRAVTSAVRSFIGTLFGVVGDLQPVQRFEQRLERTGRQRPRRAVGFVRLERRRGPAPGRRARPRRRTAPRRRRTRCALRRDANRRGSTRDRHARPESPAASAARTSSAFADRNRFAFSGARYAYGERPAGEHGALDAEIGALDRAEHPQSRDRIVARQDDDLDAPRRSALNASSLRTSGYAMPGFAGCSRRSSCSSRYGRSSAGLKTRFSSSKSNSARELIATTRRLDERGRHAREYSAAVWSRRPRGK